MKTARKGAVGSFGRKPNPDSLTPEQIELGAKFLGLSNLCALQSHDRTSVVHTVKDVDSLKRARMRDCEKELLDHLRKYEVSMTDRFSMAWHNTLDRLMEAGMVRYQKPTKHRIGRYVAVKGARPITVVPKTKKVSRKKVGSSGRRPFPPRSYTKSGHLRKAVMCGPVVCRLRVKTNGAGAFEMANVRSRTRQWTEIGRPCSTVPMRTNVDRTGTNLNHPCLPQQGLGSILQGKLIQSNVSRRARRANGVWFPTGGAQ